jgi:Na+/phosphate symporter
MKVQLLTIIKILSSSTRDLLPIILVIAFFQIFVLHRPIAHFGQIISGLVLVILGLALFVRGLELALFPLGEDIAQAFARRGSLFWLLVFAFALGFGTTIAEPALISVANKAASLVAESGQIIDTEASRQA